MFPFGSFLTEIPLLVLATAYMLYIGACALNRTKDKGNNDQPELHIQSVINISPDQDNQTYFFQKYSNTKSNNSLYDHKKIYSLYQFLIQAFYDPDGNVCFTFRYFKLFFRPPPIQKLIHSFRIIQKTSCNFGKSHQ